MSNTGPIPLFGPASALAFPEPSQTLSEMSSHVAAVERNMQAIYAGNGQTVPTMSPLLDITGCVSLVRMFAPAAQSTSTMQEAAIVSQPARPISAAALLDEIQARSSLTLEEIASVLGTSRRSLQKWKAGEAINSQNERRLRDVAEFIRQIDAGNARTTRDRLMTRSEGRLSAYDLLREQRFDAARACATGVAARSEPQLGRGAKQEIVSRLSMIADAPEPSSSVLSKHRLRSRKR